MVFAYFPAGQGLCWVAVAQTLTCVLGGFLPFCADAFHVTQSLSPLLFAGLGSFCAFQQLREVQTRHVRIIWFITRLNVLFSFPTALKGLKRQVSGMFFTVFSDQSQPVTGVC